MPSWLIHRKAKVVCDSLKFRSWKQRVPDLQGFVPVVKQTVINHECFGLEKECTGVTRPIGVLIYLFEHDRVLLECAVDLADDFVSRLIIEDRNQKFDDLQRQLGIRSTGGQLKIVPFECLQQPVGIVLANISANSIELPVSHF